MLLDYELIGNLQVSNGIVSGFNNSTNNYIKIPYSLPMGSNKIELCLSLYYPELSSSSVVLANYNDSSSGGGVVLRSEGSYNNIAYWAWDSSGTMIAEYIDLGFDLTVGTNIIKFVYENSTITWYKSTDGTSFTQGISQSGTIADFQNYLVIGASGTAWSSGNMQVNMLDSYIKVNDEYWHSKEYTKQKTRIIQRHDIAANWSTVNPVLALGEMGVETDTNKFKFGDGTTAYNELPYAAGEGGGTGSGTTITSKDGTTSYNKLALGDTLDVTDSTIKELNGVTQTNGTLNSDFEFTGANGAYLKMNERYDLAAANSWEFQIKYKHNGGSSNPTIFGYASGSDFKTPALILEGGSLKLYLSSDGSSWNLNQDNLGLVPVIGTIYYFKVGFTGSQYYIKYNTTGWSDEFTTQWTLSSTTKVYCSDYFMLMNLSLNNNYYNAGTMYLQDTALIINEQEVWRGVNITPGHLALNVNSEKIDKQDKLTAGDGIEIKYKGTLTKEIHPYNNGNIDLNITYPENEVVVNTQTTLFKNPTDMVTKDYTIIYKPIVPISDEVHICLGRDYRNYESINQYTFRPNSYLSITSNYNGGNGNWYINDETQRNAFIAKLNAGKIVLKFTRKLSGTTVTKEIQVSDDSGKTYYPASHFGYNSDAIIVTNNTGDGDGIFSEYTFVFANSNITLDMSGIEMIIGDGSLVLTIQAKPATITSIGAVQPDGTSITVSNTGVISGQDVKTFTGYSDTGTLVLKSINGVIQWVAEA